NPLAVEDAHAQLVIAVVLAPGAVPEVGDNRQSRSRPGATAILIVTPLTIPPIERIRGQVLVVLFGRTRARPIPPSVCWTGPSVHRFVRPRWGCWPCCNGRHIPPFSRTASGGKDHYDNNNPLGFGRQCQPPKRMKKKSLREVTDSNVRSGRETRKCFSEPSSCAEMFR